MYSSKKDATLALHVIIRQINAQFLFILIEVQPAAAVKILLHIPFVADHGNTG